MAQPKTPLRPFKPENIPEILKTQARWAPWKAVWNEKRGKYDKIPCQAAAPFYGLSTAKPERWLSFDAALAAWRANPERFAGLGYVMTGPHGVVGIDLDHCVSGSTIAPWAQEIITEVASYTELSPSGEGLRAFVTGEIAADWTNHDIGIEVYAGHEPRFLTVSGQKLKLAPAAVRDASLEQITQRYARERSAPSATVISMTLPDLVDELLLPSLDSLELPYATKDFLTQGAPEGKDRSRELFAAAVSLYSAGLDDATVFSTLAASPHAMGIALDHRRQDSDRALMYLWIEHCQKAKGRASSRIAGIAGIDDFEDLSAGTPSPTTNVAPSALANSALAHSTAAHSHRFAFVQAGAYTHRAPTTWAIKRVLPMAEVGVIYGESGAGKSFFALDLVMAIARGEPWRGHKSRQAMVAYVCAEGAGGFSLRLRAYSEYHGVDLTTLPLHILGDAPNLLEKKDVTDLVAALRALGKVELVVIDTLAQVTPGANENSGEDMGRALAHCKTIHRALGAMVMLVAHAGKDTSRGIRGWSGIKGALDVEINVERSDKYRAATISKMKDGAGEGDEYPFSLDSVVVAQDEDGEDITSMVLKAGNEAPKATRKGPAGNVQQTVLRVATTLLELSGSITSNQLLEATITELKAPADGKRDMRRRDVLRALESLQADGRISTAGGMVSVTGAE